MGLFADVAKVTRAVLTLDVEVARLREMLRETREATRSQTAEVRNVRERLARLEAARDADRAEMAAELSRFKNEVERAERRLTRLLPQSPNREEQS